jgi:orotate phosphoribosyltransferase
MDHAFHGMRIELIDKNRIIVMQKWFDDGLDGIAEKQGIVAEVDFDVHGCKIRSSWLSYRISGYLRRMNDAKVVADKLLQAQAVKLSPREPFTWASGWKSPIYCDNRRVLSFPYIRDYIKSEMCNVVFEKFPEADLLAGVATAGIAWGAMAADQLKLPYIYVRPKPKEHGLGNQIEGYFEKGQKTVVIEDLVSTGKSSLQVVDVLREAGLDVIGMVSIFTYQFPVSAEAFEKAGLAYYSLTDYPTLIGLAAEKQVVPAEDQELLLKWRENPSAWTGVL